MTSLTLTFFFMLLGYSSAKDLFLRMAEDLELDRCRLIASAFYICVIS